VLLLKEGVAEVVYRHCRNLGSSWSNGFHISSALLEDLRLAAGDVVKGSQAFRALSANEDSIHVGRF
jgi:hypothetical protein